MSDKVMNFDQFSKKEPLEDPKTPITTPDKPVAQKETFVNQVKFADLTQPEITEPDYTKTSDGNSIDAVDENIDEITNLQSVVTASERELIELREKYNLELSNKEKDLQAKREALAQAIAANAANAANATQVQPTSQAPTPVQQPQMGSPAPVAQSTAPIV